MEIEKLAELVRQKGVSTELYIPSGCNSDATANMLFADSRKVTPGAIFACVKGEHSDGHDYAAAAAEKGASALLCERKLDGIALPQLICADVRRNMGVAASCLYGNPSEKLKMIAITGTTGKTTTSFMTKSILESTGIKTGLLGTVFYDDGCEVTEASRTTPEADIVQLYLKKMVDNGCGACVMEASSHSIVQGRIEGIKFDAAGFSNLTVDHLDYHLTMENYYQAKKLLFTNYARENMTACINIDSKYGARLLADLGEKKCVTCSLSDPSADFGAEVSAPTIDDMEITIKATNAERKTTFPIIGRHNAENAIMAVALSTAVGADIETAVAALARLPQIPGRLEKYKISESGTCVIDFAHAPDGFERVLSTLKEVCHGRLLAAFGAGGDRDKSKRPMMGEIASRLADYVIITTDNPRTENPQVIIEEIEQGVKQHPTPYEKIADRRAAIYAGLSAMKENDIFALLGKGPESCMEINGKKLPFLDKAVVCDWCEENGRCME